MKIKQLELTGFKSFVDKTAIEFPDGVTAIVGPNGCGKSNIVDAIRWVLGEQSSKNLRGKSMEDVIFNGSENRSATGLAEVQITFDNSEGRLGGSYASFSEISVGRRLYRSGESEYLVNRAPARLKDIQEIFMDTGVGSRAHYSIIEQGKIGVVLSAKAEDRRILIEEAAGISKFRARKDAALRKIEGTQQNLLRVSDVVAEVKRQIDYTQRQASKAKRHMALKDEALGLEARLWKVDYREAHLTLNTVEADMHSQSSREESLKIQVASLETTIETLRLDLLEAEKNLQGVQSEFQSNVNRVKLLENDLEHHAQTLQQLHERREQVTSHLEQDKTSEEAAFRQLQEIRDLLTEAVAQVLDLERTFALSEKNLEEMEKESQSAHRQMEQMRDESARIHTAIVNAGTALENLAHRREDLNARIARSQEEISGHEGELSGHRENLYGAEQKLTGVAQLQLELKSKAQASQEKLRSWIEEEDSLQQQLVKKREQLATSKSRLHVLEELQGNFEGLMEGVRSIMLHQKESASPGVLGLLADFITLPKEYERAAEAVLGERLEYVIVQNQDEGIKAIDYLRQASAGRGSFVPLDLVALQTEGLDLSGDGVIGPLLNFVRANDESHLVVKALLANVILVRDLAAASNLWRAHPGRYTLVTLEGDVIEASGIMAGGRKAQAADQEEFSDASSLLRRKRAIQDLHDEVQEVQTAILTFERDLQDLDRKIQQSKQESETLQRDSHQEELQLVRQQNDLLQLREEIRRLEENLGRAQERKRDDEQLLAQLETEETRVRQTLEESQAHKQDLDGQFEDAKRQWLEFQHTLITLKDEVLRVRVRLAEVRQERQSREREVARLEKDVQDLKQRQETLQADLHRSHEEETLLRNRSTEAEEKIREILQANEIIEKQLNDDRNRYNDAHLDLQNKEAEVKAFRHEHQDLLQSIANLKIRHAEANMKVEALQETARVRQNVDLTLLIEEALNTPPDASQAEAIAETREQLAALHKQLESLGDVNLASITELEELTMRHMFLVRQKEDLENSIDTLQKTIHKVNRTSRERFKETFDAVNAKFQEIFPRLFGGGKASLLLTNEEDLLETGVDILCQPPGKKIQNVVLLSGGEKALASICLILAIFLIKPSPFCLLDEVDAPLDDANIFRFNDLLHEIAKESQLILITHNRNTMEIADFLYGVTMQEPGVSRMVSVSLK